MVAQSVDVGTAKILVVDDELSISTMMQSMLSEQGYAVRLASDGQEALRSFFAWGPSAVILDIRMPRMDGWGVLERIREVSDVPVIMLTAVGEEMDKVRGLKAGADDYLVKPVPMAELSARVQEVLRRSKGGPDTAQEVYLDHALHVDFSRHKVYLKGREVELSPQEFRLLKAFVARPGIVLSTDRILDLCWGEGEGGPENVRVYIGYLRKKLEEEPKRPQLIETVREFGYRYRAPVGAS